MATTRRFVFLFCTLFLVINFHIANVAAVCWSSIEDVHGFGGAENKVDNLDQCKSTCVRTSGCVAIDWEPRNPKGVNCWILNDARYGSTGGKGDIIHYVLDRRCTTHLPTPSKSTTRSSLTDGISGTSPAPAGNETRAGRHGGLTDTKDALAIRPAYVVIAGLGAGNLLMVVVAIVVICSYPLNRKDSYKNGASGGDGGVENYQMGNAHRDYEDGYVDANQQPPPPPPQQWGGTGYVDENDANDKRYTSSSYDDHHPPTVEENPYFNKDEIEASAAF